MPGGPLQQERIRSVRGGDGGGSNSTANSEPRGCWWRLDLSTADRSGSKLKELLKREPRLFDDSPSPCPRAGLGMAGYRLP